MHCMYVKNVYRVCLYMNVGTKPSMSVCCQRQDNQCDVLNDCVQDSCEADIHSDDDDDNE